MNHDISENNGVKCACDARRAAVILPEGVADWDLSDAYFDTGGVENPKFELNKIFNHRADGGLSFNLSKEQAALLLVSFDGAKTDHNRKYISLPAQQPAAVRVDINTMGIITEAEALELKGQAGKSIMAFNVRFIEEALKFIMCSDDGNIEVYYNGIFSPLIMKSGRLYAAVLPIKFV